MKEVYSQATRERDKIRKILQFFAKDGSAAQRKLIHQVNICRNCGWNPYRDRSETIIPASTPNKSFFAYSGREIFWVLATGNGTFELCSRRGNGRQREGWGGPGAAGAGATAAGVAGAVVVAVFSVFSSRYIISLSRCCVTLAACRICQQVVSRRCLLSVSMHYHYYY